MPKFREGDLVAFKGDPNVQYVINKVLKVPSMHPEKVRYGYHLIGSNREHPFFLTDALEEELRLYSDNSGPKDRNPTE